MFKKSATNLLTVSPASFDEWMNSFDTVLFDCDGNKSKNFRNCKCLTTKNLSFILTGVLWIGPKVFEGSVETVNHLQAIGKKVYFVTNSPVKTRSELQQDAAKRGFNITENQIISASYATAKYLHDLNFTKKVYLIGHSAVLKELSMVGIECIKIERNVVGRNLHDMVLNGVKLNDEVGAVIVSFDSNFNYNALFEASNYVKKAGCLFLATSFDEVYPTKDGGVVPLIGPIVSAIEMASGLSPTIVGKPSSIMYETLLHSDDGIVPERTLMVGDSAKYDILFGFNCRMQTLLVGSGLNSIDEVGVWQRSNVLDDKKLIPDVYLPKLGDLLTLLLIK